QRVVTVIQTTDVCKPRIILYRAGDHLFTVLVVLIANAGTVYAAVGDLEYQRLPTPLRAGSHHVNHDAALVFMQFVNQCKVRTRAALAVLVAPNGTEEAAGLDVC